MRRPQNPFVGLELSVVVSGDLFVYNTLVCICIIINNVAVSIVHCLQIVL